VLNGQLSFEDATGRRGNVAAAGFAWKKAGSLVWHEGGSAAREPLRVFQIWIAHGATRGSDTVASEYIAPDEVEQDGPVRVVLGEFGRARSRIAHAPPDVNCFHVRLKHRERFRFALPAGHRVSWLAVDRGGLQLQAGKRVYWEQIAVFCDSGGVIEAQAEGETSFVLGSAKRRTLS
jgi:redox-sensitive bicupin YhaK (pirin superfamily)